MVEIAKHNAWLSRFYYLSTIGCAIIACYFLEYAIFINLIYLKITLYLIYYNEFQIQTIIYSKKIIFALGKIAIYVTLLRSVLLFLISRIKAKNLDMEIINFHFISSRVTMLKNQLINSKSIYTPQNSKISILLFAIILIAAFINLIRLAAILHISWDTTIPEDSIVYSILAVSRGDYALYRDYTRFPYTTTPYGPLLYLFAGYLAKLLGGSVADAYLAGRIISLLSLGLSLGLVYLLAKRAGSSSYSALFAALLACSIPTLYPWATSCRPDILALVFSLYGMLILKPEANSFQPKALLAWIAAFFVKPSFISGPAAWTLYLLINKKYKSAFQWIILFGLSTCAVIALTEYATDGKYISNVFMANLASPSFIAFKKFTVLLFPFGGIAFCMGIIGVFISGMKSRLIPAFIKLLCLFAITSTLLFTTAALKAGSSVNYFVEPIFLWSALAALSVDFLRKWPGKSNAVIVCLKIMIITFCCWLLFSYIEVWVSKFPYPIQKQEQRALDTLIRKTPGNILFISNGQGMRLGRGTTLHDSYNHSYLESAGKLDSSSFAQRIERREFSAILKYRYNSYAGYTNIPPDLLNPILRNYQPIKNYSTYFNMYTWLVPRQQPLHPHKPEFPSIAGSNTLVFRAGEYSSDNLLYMEKYHSGGVMFISSGWLEKSILIPHDGMYQFDLYASSTEFPGTWANASIYADNVLLHTFIVDQLVVTRFSSRHWLKKGFHPIKIRFLNSAFSYNHILNLFVNRLEISPVPIKITEKFGN